MAPKLPASTSHERLIQHNASRAMGRKPDLEKLLNDRTNDDDDANHSNDATIGLLRQLALSAGLLPSDAGLVFMQLTMLPCLQSLGVPVNLVTISGCFSGSLALLALPLIGWISDGGDNPHRRKKPAVVVSSLLFLLAYSLIGAGCLVHVLAEKGSPPPSPGNNSFLTLAPVSWNYTDVGQLTSERPSSSSTLESLSSQTPSTVLSSDSESLLDQEWLQASLLSKSQTAPRTSPLTQHAATSPLPGSGQNPQRPANPATKTSADNGDDNLGQTPAGPHSFTTGAEGSGGEIVEPSSAADPLGLGIPLGGLLAILGFVFIDTGNDLSNCCLKSFMLASTAKQQHVSLLVIGVMMSAVGGCVAAVLGLLDFTGWIPGTQQLEAVPTKAMLESVVFAALTVTFVATTILSAPRIHFDQPREVKSSPIDALPRRQMSYGAMDSESIMISLTASPLVIETINEEINANTEYTEMPRILKYDHSSKFHSGSFPGITTDDFTDDIIPEEESSDVEPIPEDTNPFIDSHSVRESERSLSLRQHSVMERETRSRSSTWRGDTSVECTDAEQYQNSSRHNDSIHTGKQAIRGKQESSHFEDAKYKCGCCKPMSSQKRKLLLICVSMFFMAGAWQSFNTCTTDYLGKVIYGGNPEADPNSQSYAAYQRGLTTGSFGVLILNVAYVITNLLQRKLLATLGPKLEYLVVCGLLVGLLVALELTDNMIVFLFTAVIFGCFRSVMNTVPYVMANDICQEESRSLCGKSSGPKVGTTMALVTGMIPLSFVLVSALTGPLISLTGDPAFPMYYTIACAAAAALVFSCT